MRLALYVCLKNICDGVGGQDESNGTPLDPPLFWLDNIFKEKSVKEARLCIIIMHYKGKTFLFPKCSAMCCLYIFLHVYLLHLIFYILHVQISTLFS